MADGKLLPYLDIPFQHGSQKILKAMKRPAAAENTLKRIAEWRNTCPEITLRSTFIVGFPGETDDDFQELLGWLEEAQLDRVGCFEYSPVDGATANELANPVPDEVKQMRHQVFMETQAKISASRLQKQVGSRQIVLIDQTELLDEDDKEFAIGRTAGNAPEIDGVVHIENDGYEISAGDFIEVDITAAEDHDLIGRIVA